MIIIALLLVGLCLGSFINALVWRVHEQSHELTKKTPNKSYLRDLSLLKGRSMCPHCHHSLSVRDLLPLISWIALKGKCRYCKKPIGTQYPIVEASTAVLFILSYVFWPSNLLIYKVPTYSVKLFQNANGLSDVYFILWLILLTGLISLVVYDIKWYLLPSRIIYPLGVVGLLMATILVAGKGEPLKALVNEILAVLIGGGIFYVLYLVSNGKWIGGGDVRLGWLLGLVAGTVGRSILLLFLASFSGTIISLPLLLTKRLNKTSIVPFGPFLIAGLILVELLGFGILKWYQQTFLFGSI